MNEHTNSNSINPSHTGNPSPLRDTKPQFIPRLSQDGGAHRNGTAPRAGDATANSSVGGDWTLVPPDESVSSIGTGNFGNPVYVKLHHDGRVYQWCRHCGCWTPLHHTDEHDASSLSLESLSLSSPSDSRTNKEVQIAEAKTPIGHALKSTEKSPIGSSTTKTSGQTQGESIELADKTSHPRGKTLFLVNGPHSSFECKMRHPFDIQRKHFGGRRLKCWAKTSTDGDGFFWWRIPLEKNPAVFDSMRPHLPESPIELIFQELTAPSPNSAPIQSSFGTEFATPGNKLSKAFAVEKVQKMSCFDEAATHASVINEIEPISYDDINDVKDIVLLHFNVPGSSTIQTLAMSLTILEKFIESEYEKGSDIRMLELKDVTCKGDEIRNFQFTAYVWVRSILKHSKRLRGLYFRVMTSSVLREEQLKDLKSCGDLFDRLLYCVSDMLTFKTDAKNRLLVPVQGDSPPAFLSGFYFEEEEAKWVAQIELPNSKTLSDAVQEEIEEKKGSELCSSHHLAPIFFYAFEIKNGFHTEKKFKKEMATWIKKRTKDLKSQKRRN